MTLLVRRFAPADLEAVAGIHSERQAIGEALGGGAPVVALLR